MHPIMLVSEVVLDPAIGGAWFEGGPAIVYDGLGIELEKSTPTVVAGCLACSVPLLIDFSRLDHAIVLWRFMGEPWAQELIDAFGLLRRGSGELISICDGLDLDAYLLAEVCGACTAMHGVVLGYGEYQPSRYIGTYLGLALVRPVTVSET
jgi:hypothetical protein